MSGFKKVLVILNAIGLVIIAGGFVLPLVGNRYRIAQLERECRGWHQVALRLQSDPDSVAAGELRDVQPASSSSARWVQAFTAAEWTRPDPGRTGAEADRSQAITLERERLDSILERLTSQHVDRPVDEYRDSLNTLIELGHFVPVSIHDLEFPSVAGTKIADEANRGLWAAVDHSPHVQLWHEEGRPASDEEATGTTIYRLTGPLTRSQLAAVRAWLRNRLEAGETWRWRITLEGEQAAAALDDLIDHPPRAGTQRPAEAASDR